MLILCKQPGPNADGRLRPTFVTQMEQVLGTCLDRGIKVVTNAGGLNPAGCADAVREVADRLGLSPTIAYVEATTCCRASTSSRPPASTSPTSTPASRSTAGAGSSRPTPTSAAGASSRRCDAGADIVVCRPGHRRRGRASGRRRGSTDWARDDWDALAGAVVAGHVIECGAQATGGNYCVLRRGPRPRPTAGFPIAEIAADGSSRHHQAPRHRRRWSRRHGHRPAALRDRRARVPRTPTSSPRFDTIRPRAGRPRPGADHRHRAASRRRRRPRSAIN